jgi:DNA-binding IclR family transcriptional regulator
VHRALASLTRAGLAAKASLGHYRPGDEFLRLAFAHHEARPDHVRVRSTLQELAERYGETAHYAVLDGAEVVYRSKVDPPTGALRLTSTVGGRNPVHCTAVGKSLLSWMLPDDDAAAAWARGRTLDKRTENTITNLDAFVLEIAETRARGYAVDREENEVGINCLAVPAFLTSPTHPSGAVSVSALTYRTPLQRLIDDVPSIVTMVGTARGALSPA